MDTAPSVELHAAAAELGVHYQTAYRWVRGGQLPAVKVAGRYQVERAALTAFARDRATPSPVPSPGPRRLASQAKRMHEALCSGDDAEARRIARVLEEQGAGVADVISQVLSPSLQRIGQSWHDGDISIWVEHRASAIVERILGELTPTPRGRRRGTAVVAAVAGDLHSLPTAMAAATLRADNWHVEHLGANMPLEALVDFCETHDVSVAVLSVTNSAVTGDADEVAGTLRLAGVPVVLGGPGRSLEDLVAETREAAR